MKSAAHMLAGRSLPNEWFVREKIDKHIKSTGSNFSIGYIVTNKLGHQAFLKALDFSGAFKTANPAKTLNSMTEAFLFELNILETCRNEKLKRVVQILDTGNIIIQEADQPNTVQYIIMEMANGDIRKTLAESEKLDWAWKMRCLHHACVGVDQLHSVKIAHQDLKPSNVLDCGEDGHKIADFGRSSRQNISGPFDAFAFAGDTGYAPPEVRYDLKMPSWHDRMAVDCYMMGGLVFFLVTESTLWNSVYSYLDEAFWPGRWSGKYADVLPHYRNAFDFSVNDFNSFLPVEIKQDLVTILRELCEPDPEYRGHPKNRQGHQNQYSLERYVSIFDLLAVRCEVRLRQ